MREFGDTNMLVSKIANICITPNMNDEICVSPNANPQCEQVEYRSHRVPNAKFRIGHVDFLLFVLISFMLVTQHRVEYGLKVTMYLCNDLDMAILLTLEWKHDSSKLTTPVSCLIIYILLAYIGISVVYSLGFEVLGDFIT